MLEALEARLLLCDFKSMYLLADIIASMRHMALCCELFLVYLAAGLTCGLLYTNEATPNVAFVFYVWQ